MIVNMKKIDATGESVEQFELTEFFKRRNAFIRFLRLSHKRRLLRKKSPLHQMFVITLRIDR
jgi:hypothetical protein